MTNFEKLIISLVGLLIIAIIFLGFVAYSQQKSISGLQSVPTGVSDQNQTNKASANDSASKYSGLQGDLKLFTGKIAGISGNQLVVDVKLTDFSKLKNSEKLKNGQQPLNLNRDDFEAIDKKITVNTNEKTSLGPKKLTDFKIGDMVSVWSDESPYQSNTVTAKSISLFGGTK